MCAFLDYDNTTAVVQMRRNTNSDPGFRSRTTPEKSREFNERAQLAIEDSDSIRFVLVVLPVLLGSGMSSSIIAHEGRFTYHSRC